MKPMNGMHYRLSGCIIDRRTHRPHVVVGVPFSVRARKSHCRPVQVRTDRQWLLGMISIVAGRISVSPAGTSPSVLEINVRARIWSKRLPRIVRTTLD